MDKLPETGPELGAIRERVGVRQHVLAQRMGLTSTQISHFERQIRPARDPAFPVRYRQTLLEIAEEQAELARQSLKPRRRKARVAA